MVFKEDTGGPAKLLFFFLLSKSKYCSREHHCLSLRSFQMYAGKMRELIDGRIA